MDSLSDPMIEHELVEMGRLGMPQAARDEFFRRKQAFILACREIKFRGGHVEVLYGSCEIGSDPRTYYPDLECSQAAEVANWLLACDAWDRGLPLSAPVEQPGICQSDGRYGVGIRYIALTDEEYAMMYGRDGDDQFEQVG